MAIVKINKNRYTVDSLYQWDLNQVLKIHGLSLPKTPEIHFTNASMEGAIVRQATMDNTGVITVDIPNSLLQKSYKITAYVCINEGDTFRSLYQINIPVEARNRPLDYTISDNDYEIYSFNALNTRVDNILNDCNEAIEKAKSDMDKVVSDIDYKISNVRTPVVVQGDTLEPIENPDFSNRPFLMYSDFGTIPIPSQGDYFECRNGLYLALGHHSSGVSFLLIRPY